jgi:hypothetical protein
VRKKSEDCYFLMLHGDASYAIPDGRRMQEFAYRLVDKPEKVKADAAAMVSRALASAERLRDHAGLDGFALCLRVSLEKETNARS